MTSGVEWDFIKASMSFCTTLNPATKASKPSKAVFLKRFYFIALFSISTRGFRPPSMTKWTKGSKFKEFYLKKVLNSWTKPFKSWTWSKQLYYDANITFRILVKIIQGCGSGAHNKIQKEPDQEFSWKFTTIAGVIVLRSKTNRAVMSRYCI